MFIDNRKSFMAVLVVCGALFAESLSAMAGGEMTPDEVWALLPKGADLEDPREIANYVELVKQGEAIYGALLDIVRENDNPLIAGTALSVLRASKGDKREVVAELGKILHDRQAMTGRLNETMLVLLAEAITDMGDSRDRQLLLPLFSHPSEKVRHAGRYCTDNLAAKVSTPPPSVVEDSTGGPLQDGLADSEEIKIGDNSRVHDW